MESLTSLDISNINTDIVIDTSHMFERNSKIKNLTFKNFYTINVISMEKMFNGMRDLEYLDISSFK